MVKYYFKSVKSNKVYELDKPRTGCWIEVVDPVEKDIEFISALTGLSLEDLDDVLDRYETPRIEKQKEGILIFLRIPNGESEGLYSATFAVIISPQYLITFTSKGLEMAQTILKQNKKANTTQRSKLLIAILLEITLLYSKKVRKVRAGVLKNKDLERISDDDILSLVETEEVLNQFLASLIPTRGVVEAILTGKYLQIFEHDHELLDDLLISINQAVDVCNVNLKSVLGLRDSYQILFTNRLNRRVNSLTIITVVLTVPTIVFSAYGMNVIVPGQGTSGAFWLVILLSFIIAALVYLLFSLRRN